MCVSLGIHHAVQRRIPPMISTCTGRYLVYLASEQEGFGIRRENGTLSNQMWNRVQVPSPCRTLA